MRLLRDEGVPFCTAAHRRDAGHGAEHSIELNMRVMADATTLEKSRQEGAVVGTLDSAFYKLLAASDDDKPSMVRLRVARLAPLAMAEMIGQIVAVLGNRRCPREALCCRIATARTAPRLQHQHRRVGRVHHFRLKNRRRHASWPPHRCHHHHR